MMITVTEIDFYFIPDLFNYFNVTYADAMTGFNLWGSISMVQNFGC